MTGPWCYHEFSIQLIGLAIAAVAITWALMVWVSGGLTIEVLGGCVSSRSPLRPASSRG